MDENEIPKKIADLSEHDQKSILNLLEKDRKTWTYLLEKADIQSVLNLYIGDQLAENSIGITEYMLQDKYIVLDKQYFGEKFIEEYPALFLETENLKKLPEDIKEKFIRRELDIKDAIKYAGVLKQDNILNENCFLEDAKNAITRNFKNNEFIECLQKHNEKFLQVSEQYDWLFNTRIEYGDLKAITDLENSEQFTPKQFAAMLVLISPRIFVQIGDLEHEDALIEIDELLGEFLYGTAEVSLNTEYQEQLEKRLLKSKNINELLSNFSISLDNTIKTMNPQYKDSDDVIFDYLLEKWKTDVEKKGGDKSDLMSLINAKYFGGDNLGKNAIKIANELGILSKDEEQLLKKYEAILDVPYPSKQQILNEVIPLVEDFKKSVQESGIDTESLYEETYVNLIANRNESISNSLLKIPESEQDG